MVCRYPRGLRGAVTRVAPGLKYGCQKFVARTGWERITVVGLVSAGWSMLLANALASSTPVNRMTRMLVMFPALGHDENSRSSTRQNRGRTWSQGGRLAQGSTEKIRIPATHVDADRRAAQHWPLEPVTVRNENSIELLAKLGSVPFRL